MHLNVNKQQQQKNSFYTITPWGEKRKNNHYKHSEEIGSFQLALAVTFVSLFFTSSLTIALVFFLFLWHSVADMWPNRENAEEEPEWVKSERKQFVNYRDKNKDGRLDKTEVKDWILPENFNHAQAESKHLIFETDVDKVCTLLHRKIFCCITVAFSFLHAQNTILSLLLGGIVYYLYETYWMRVEGQMVKWVYRTKQKNLGLGKMLSRSKSFNKMRLRKTLG